MDTKVEQEMFGYDPSDPEGLDSLHSHIHPEWPVLDGQGDTGLAVGELEAVGSGRGKSLIAAHASDFAELELLAAAHGEFPQTEAERLLASGTLSPAERVRLKEATFLERYGTAQGIG